MLRQMKDVQQAVGELQESKAAKAAGQMEFCDMMMGKLYDYTAGNK